MITPFELPVEKEISTRFSGKTFYRIIDANKCSIAVGLTEKNADYIVQAINSYEKLVNENRQLKEQPRCHCGGELEGLGVDIKTKNTVYKCKKCQAQIIFEQALKEKP